MKKIYLFISLGLATIGAQAQTALHFDAINDHIEIDTVMDYIYDFTGDFTIEAWINAETGGLWPSVVTKFDNVAGARYGYWFGINGSGTVGMQIFNGTAGVWPNVSGTTFLQDNNWHHIAGVMDSDTMKVYVDGILEGTLLTTFTPVYNNHALWFGNDAENDIFHGTMDDVRAWNIARTPAEIANYKDSCLDGSQSNLVGLWHFEEGNGSQVTDYTVNNHFGTLVNMDTVTSWTSGINCSVCNFTSITGTDTRTECNSYTWIDGMNYTASNNTATFNIVSGAANGCDSLVTLDLTINNVSDLTTSVAGVTVSANNSGATYQWLDCDNGNAIISSETGQTYTATANGNYAVELTENGCVDTSACAAITTVGILEHNFGNKFKIYPNPTDGNFSIDLGDNHNSITIKMTDLNGKLIHSEEYNNSQLLNLNIDEPSGVYLLKIETTNNKAIIRLVKE